MKLTLIHNVQDIYFIHSGTRKTSFKLNLNCNGIMLKVKGKSWIMFITLIGLPGGFGAWLCSLLAKARLITSVNPWFRKPYVAARYAMGANCYLGTLRFALLHFDKFHDAKDSILKIIIVHWELICIYRCIYKRRILIDPNSQEFDNWWDFIPPVCVIVV